MPRTPMVGPKEVGFFGFLMLFAAASFVALLLYLLTNMILGWATGLLSTALGQLMLGTFSIVIGALIAFAIYIGFYRGRTFR